MTSDELKRMVPWLQGLRLDGGTGDSALFSCVRIYTSLHRLVSLEALDGEFGGRELYRARLEGLCALLRCRYPLRTSYGERAEILYALSTTINDNCLSVEGSVLAADDRLADALVTSYMEKYGKGDSGTDGFFSVMRLVLSCLYGIEEDDGEEVHPWLSFLRGRFSAWADEMDGDGRWRGVPEVEALERLTLLEMYGTLFPEGSYDDVFRRGYACYCSRTVLPVEAGGSHPHGWLRACGLRYDLVLRDPSGRRGDAGLSERIAGELERHSGSLAEGDERWLHCRSLAIEECCRNIAEGCRARLCGKTA